MIFYFKYQVIELEPISVDDAIENMEAVGHDFYVFRYHAGLAWHATCRDDSE